MTVVTAWFITLTFVFLFTAIVVVERFLDFIHHVDSYIDARIRDLLRHGDDVRLDEMIMTKNKIGEYKKHINKMFS